MPSVRRHDRQSTSAPRSPARLYALLALLAGALFVLDVNLPRGIAAGVGYVAVVMLSLWIPGRAITLHVASGCILLALLGAFETHPWLAGIATLDVIFAAYYMLPMVHSVFFNKLETDENREIEDLSSREMAIMAPLCALMIVIGWHPTPILERMEPSVRAVIERVEAAAPATEAALTLEELPAVESETDAPEADDRASDDDE